jgi:hypothetical protein
MTTTRSRWVIVILIGIITFGITFWRGTTPDINVLLYAGTIVAVLGGAWFCFDRLIWRWTILFPHLVSVPCIHGKWNGDGYIAVPPETNPVAYKITNTDIEQRYSGLKITITFEDKTVSTFQEMASVAVSGEETKVCALNALYKNTQPGKATQFRSANMSFDAKAEWRERPKEITIHYSTTDGVIGKLELKKVK